MSVKGNEEVVDQLRTLNERGTINKSERNKSEEIAGRNRSPGYCMFVETFCFPGKHLL